MRGLVNIYSYAQTYYLSIAVKQRLNSALTCYILTMLCLMRIPGVDCFPLLDLPCSCSCYIQREVT